MKRNCTAWVRKGVSLQMLSVMFSLISLPIVSKDVLWSIYFFFLCSYRVYCLLGDGECSEGSVWEAMAFASHYQLDNMVAILDVNRLGQSEPAPLQHDVETYRKRCEAFGSVLNSLHVYLFLFLYKMLECVLVATFCLEPALNWALNVGNYQLTIAVFPLGLFCDWFAVQHVCFEVNMYSVGG